MHIETPREDGALPHEQGNLEFFNPIRGRSTGRSHVRLRGGDRHVLSDTQARHARDGARHPRSRDGDDRRRLRRRQVRHHLDETDQALRAGLTERGKAGAPGPAGPAGAAGVGAAGPQGPAGPAGATGATGETGATGATGKEGVPGKAGKAGEPWTAGGTLPSGKTETGVWALSSGAAVSGQQAQISFPIPLAEQLTWGEGKPGEPEDEVHYINPSGKEVTTTNVEVASHPDCPGTVSKPEATPDNLCVYASLAVSEGQATSNEGIYNPAIHRFGCSNSRRPAGQRRRQRDVGGLRQVVRLPPRDNSACHRHQASTSPGRDFPRPPTRLPTRKAIA